ncbi:MAG: hypothetical protein DRI44_06965 [Chlamydiae bacterium]|nr:MAG: hypothetical protein DRI44_06965 [Chlamydiota bacterium]
MPIPLSIHNLCDLLDKAAKESPNKIAARDREKKGYSPWTYSELSNYSYLLAAHLQQLNVKENQTLALLIPNSKWWGMAFFASLACDACVVPIDTKLSAEEIASIIKAANIKKIITADIYNEKIKKLKLLNLNLENIISIDLANNGKAFLETISKNKSSNIKRNNLRIHPAVIIFTSGTTGIPKGVVLTHGNLLTDIFDMLRVLEISEYESFVSILPLNHVFEITGGFLSPIALHATITYVRSLRPDLIFKTIKESNMTIMMVVPSFLKLFLSKIKHQAAKKAGRKFELLFHAGITLNNIGLPVGKLLFANIKKNISPAFKGFVCGGAPLDVDVIRELATLGITVLQGYGLTETSPVVAVNTIKYNRFGSVGKKLPTAEFRIDYQNNYNHGELLVRGGMVFRGYFNNPEETNKVFCNDWFKTGDLAKIDKDGYLYIIGRVKSIIVTASGKNIYPEYVERFLKKCDAVSEACVVGIPEKSGAEKPVAVISLKPDEIFDENKIKNEIKSLLKNIAEYQRPKEFIFIEKLPLTPSLKVKRKEVLKLIKARNLLTH